MDGSHEWGQELVHRVHPLWVTLVLSGGMLVLLVWTAGWFLLAHLRGRRLLVVILVAAPGWVLLRHDAHDVPTRLHA